jgi:nucleoside-diphosphate-sugar epimerase
VSERPCSVRHLIGLLLHLTGRSDLRPDAAGDAGENGAAKRVSAQRARRELGWEARTSLESGLVRTLEWHRNTAAGRPVTVP